MPTGGRAGEGRFGISHFILINGLNFLFELFGATESYMQTADNPEKVAEALDFAFRLNAWVQDRFFESVRLVEGGTCSTMASWLPGRVISESVDPFHMASAAYFEKWGAGPLQRALDRYDGGVVHLHGNGRHLLEVVSRVPGVIAMKVGDDGDVPPALDVLAELKARTGHKPLIVLTTFDEFAEALTERRLVGGVLYHVAAVSDIAAANRTMEQVRSYEPCKS